MLGANIFETLSVCLEAVQQLTQLLSTKDLVAINKRSSVELCLLALSVCRRCAQCTKRRCFTIDALRACTVTDFEFTMFDLKIELEGSH